MLKKILFLSPISIMAFPLAGVPHELVMNFDPLEGQTENQMVSDLKACKEKVVEDGVEEPHPLREKDPLDRRPEAGRAGTGVSVGGVGVGVGIGHSSSNEDKREGGAIEEAKHLQRHRVFETAVTACMEEKGYDK